MSGGRLASFAATIGSGFFGGILIGYANKRILKIATVIFGLFFAALEHLPSMHSQDSV
jgi:uncharacterized membrane protein (Fun14 family)